MPVSRLRFDLHEVYNSLPIMVPEPATAVSNPFHLPSRATQSSAGSTDGTSAAPSPRETLTTGLALDLFEAGPSHLDCGHSFHRGAQSATNRNALMSAGHWQESAYAAYLVNLVPRM